MSQSVFRTLKSLLCLHSGTSSRRPFANPESQVTSTRQSTLPVALDTLDTVCNKATESKPVLIIVNETQIAPALNQDNRETLQNKFHHWTRLHYTAIIITSEVPIADMVLTAQVEY